MKFEDYHGAQDKKIEPAASKASMQLRQQQMPDLERTYLERIQKFNAVSCKETPQVMNLSVLQQNLGN